MITIQDARKAAGLSQQDMSDILEIPKRTIESWEAGERTCPAWAEKLVLKALSGIKEGYDLFTDWTVERLRIDAQKCKNLDDFIKKHNNESWTEEFTNKKTEVILRDIFEENNK